VHINELYAEFHSAQERGRREQDTLNRYGWTLEVSQRIGGVGAALVRIRGGWYEPDDEGEWAIIVPAWNGKIADSRSPLYYQSPLLDLIAWRPLQRYAMPSRRQAAIVLGAFACSAVFQHDQPLRLFRSPLEWAEKGGEDAGAVILDWASCGFLLDGRPIEAEDMQHARDIERRLGKLKAARTPSLPKIFTKGPADAR